MIQYLHHLSIGVRDLEKSQSFYRNFMGFRLIARPDLGFPGVWLKLGQTQLHLIKREGDVLPEGGLPGAMHTAFQTESLQDLDQLEKKLKENDIPFRRSIQRSSGINQIFFKDPDGFNIELGYYPD